MGIQFEVVSSISAEPIIAWNSKLPEGYRLILNSSEEAFSARRHPELQDVSWSYSGLSFWKESVAHFPGASIAFGELSGVYGIIRPEEIPMVLDYLRSLPLDGLSAEEETDAYQVAIRTQELLNFFEQTVGIPGAAVAIR